MHTMSPALGFVWQEAQNGRPARPEGVRPRSVPSVREDAERLRTPLADFLSLLLGFPNDLAVNHADYDLATPDLARGQTR